MHLCQVGLCLLFPAIIITVSTTAATITVAPSGTAAALQPNTPRPPIPTAVNNTTHPTTPLFDPVSTTLSSFGTPFATTILRGDESNLDEFFILRMMFALPFVFAGVGGILLCLGS
ncbi:hypothetical protein BGZ60DRAFT_527591 [Tricladium varicosporioides]|nr:hypothetical protein BGZ60DRAFT_527591 [Hymenoscyphus varicosporioides]